MPSVKKKASTLPARRNPRRVRPSGTFTQLVRSELEALCKAVVADSLTEWEPVEEAAWVLRELDITEQGSVPVRLVLAIAEYVLALPPGPFADLHARTHRLLALIDASAVFGGRPVRRGMLCLVP